jgi:hypothetical protein
MDSRLQETEQAIQDQLDRVYRLVEEGKNTAIIQLEYKRYVERLSEKYQLLFESLEKEKHSLGAAEADTQAEQLRAQYSQDLVTAAAAIDAALEQTQDQPNSNQ